MSYDPIEIVNITIRAAEEIVFQLELFDEIDTAPDRPEMVSNQHEDHTEEVVHHIRSPDEIVRSKGESEATITPSLTEASLKMARALTARSRALSSKSKYFNPDIK